MTLDEEQRMQMLLLKIQQDQADPFVKLLVEIDAIRQGLPVTSPEYKHLEMALKHVLICKYAIGETMRGLSDGVQRDGLRGLVDGK